MFWVVEPISVCACVRVWFLFQFASLAQSSVLRRLMSASRRRRRRRKLMFASDTNVFGAFE